MLNSPYDEIIIPIGIILVILFAMRSWATCGKALSYSHEVKRIEYESGRVVFMPFVFRHGKWFFGLLKWKERRGLSVEVENGAVKRSRMSISDEATSSLPTLSLAYDAVYDAIVAEEKELKDNNVVKVVTI